MAEGRVYPSVGWWLLSFVALIQQAGGTIISRICEVDRAQVLTILRGKPQGKTDPRRAFE